MVLRTDAFFLQPLFVRRRSFSSLLRLPAQLRSNYLTPKDEEMLNSTEDKTQLGFRWYLKAPIPYSMLIDHGWSPTTWGIVNDVVLSDRTVVFHARVSLPYDLSWIADPIIFGRLDVVAHFLTMFSTTERESRLGWFDVSHRMPGEVHMARFYWHSVRQLNMTFDVKIFDFQFSLYRPDPKVNAQLLQLRWNYAAYQELTIFNKHPTKFMQATCNWYEFFGQEVNLSTVLPTGEVFDGEVGFLKLHRLPMHDCARAAVPPGVHSCYAQYAKAIMYKKGKGIVRACTPYCGMMAVSQPRGLCLSMGRPPARSRNSKMYRATLSFTPPVRNISGEMKMFTVVFPHRLRKNYSGPRLKIEADPMGLPLPWDPPPMAKDNKSKSNFYFKKSKTVKFVKERRRGPSGAWVSPAHVKSSLGSNRSAHRLFGN